MILIEKKSTSAFLIFIALVALGAYWGSFSNAFTHFDDQIQITENQDIVRMNWDKLKTIFSSSYVGMYQPVSTLIYGLLIGFFGIKPAVFHGFSFLLHLLNGWLVFLVLKRLVRKELYIIPLVGLFVLHPMQVESVSWASATSNLIFTAFYLTAILSFLKHPTRTFDPITFSWFILACLSKATAVSLPVLLLAYLVVIEKKSWITSFVQLLPYFLISLLIGTITILSREGAEHLTNLSLSYSFYERALIFCYTIVFYPLQYLLPLELSAFYSFPNKLNGTFNWIYYAAPFILLAIIFGVYRFRKNKHIVFGSLFYIISIGPVLQLIPVGSQVVTDRYIYLSGIGVLIALYPIIKLIKKPKALLIGSVACFLGLAIYAQQRTTVWQSDEAIWGDVLEKDQYVAQAWNNKGIIAEKEGKIADAERFYTRAIQLNPQYADPYTNRGNIYAAQGKSEAALNDFNQAIRLKPNHADALFNRANEFIKIGDFNTALEDLNASIAVKPQPDALTNRGLIYIQTKKWEKALADLNASLAQNPNNAQAYYLRALVKYQTVDATAGCADFQQAASLGDENAKQALLQYCR